MRWVTDNMLEFMTLTSVLNYRYFRRVTIAGMDVVVPSVTWAKFRSQAEGAKIASEYLWGTAT